MDIGPNVVAGFFFCRFQQHLGLIGDVLEVADESGAVVAGVEVGLEGGVSGDAVGVAKECGEVFLELGAGDGGGAVRLLGHRTASFIAGWVACPA